MKIPQFLYVPALNTLSDISLIIETRKGIYFRIVHFITHDDKDNFINNYETTLSEYNGFNAVVHKKYLFGVVSLNSPEKTTLKRLDKLANIGCDWFVQFYLENLKKEN